MKKVISIKLSFKQVPTLICFEEKFFFLACRAVLGLSGSKKANLEPFKMVPTKKNFFIVNNTQNGNFSQGFMKICV